MSIEDAKEGALGPRVTFLVLWLHDVQDYRNTIFVVVADYALVDVSSVCSQDPVASRATLCRFMVGQHYCFWIDDWWVGAKEKRFERDILGFGRG